MQPGAQAKSLVWSVTGRDQHGARTAMSGTITIPASAAPSGPAITMTSDGFSAAGLAPVAPMTITMTSGGFTATAA